MLNQKEENKKIFEQEPKYRCRLRTYEDHEEYKTALVYFNGVPYQIEVGKDIELPKTLYDICITRNLI